WWSNYRPRLNIAAQSTRHQVPIFDFHDRRYAQLMQLASKSNPTARPPSVESAPLDPVDAVERGDAIGLGHGRVIEGRVGKIADIVGRAGLAHNGLADMNDLGGLVAKTVDPQNLEGFAVK